MAVTRHILSNFHDSLHDLRERLLVMGSLSQRNLASATHGILHRSNRDCELAIEEDVAIDDLEKSVDLIGIDILTRFQPVAGDLREIIAAMRISSNLERIADQATSIARRGKDLNGWTTMEEVMWLEPLIRRVMDLFKDSLRAFSDRDAPLARELKERDREIDQLNKQVAHRLTRLIEEHPKQAPAILHLILIARSLERVGDHATNIGEDVVFAEEAEDIRHARKTLGVALDI